MPQTHAASDGRQMAAAPINTMPATEATSRDARGLSPNSWAAAANEASTVLRALNAAAHFNSACSPLRTRSKLWPITSRWALTETRVFMANSAHVDPKMNCTLVEQCCLGFLAKRSFCCSFRMNYIFASISSVIILSLGLAVLTGKAIMIEHQYKPFLHTCIGCNYTFHCTLNQISTQYV